jgi:myo-inositol-hexaphosphate 3-phosphohydrolase
VTRTHTKPRTTTNDSGAQCRSKSPRIERRTDPNDRFLPSAESTKRIRNNVDLRYQLSIVTQMGEITAATTFDHVRAFRFNPTQRRIDDLDDSTVFAPPTLNDGDLEALARQATVDKNDASIVSAG